MRLVMTLRTRDNRDTVDAHLAFHLSAGVDFVIANDHRSVDGTREVLEEYERRGHLHLIRRDDERFVAGEWVDEMASLAATRFGADWVFHTDADEFWWPRSGNLKDVLATVPARFGVIRAVWRHFAARPDDGSHFAERMTVRLAARSTWMGVEHTFHPNVKVAHRADPSTTVRRGNHDVDASLLLLRSWYPFEVLHFPLRTLAQAEKKYGAWQPVLEAGVYVATHVDTAVEALRAGRFASFYDGYVVDERGLKAGLGDGTMHVDTRLRDALRRLNGDIGRPLPEVPSLLKPSPDSLAFPTFDVAAEADLADDIMSLADSAFRLEQQVDQLDARLDAIERPVRRTMRRRPTIGAS